LSTHLVEPHIYKLGNKKVYEVPEEKLEKNVVNLDR